MKISDIRVLKLTFFLIAITFNGVVQAQAPGNFKSIWQQAGYLGEIPDIDTNIINVKDEGALADGTTVMVDDAYLYQSIRDPQAQIVAGYEEIVMPATAETMTD